VEGNVKYCIDVDMSVWRYGHIHKREAIVLALSPFSPPVHLLDFYLTPAPTLVWRAQGGHDPELARGGGLAADF
jgi:hypothetical protein